MLEGKISQCGMSAEKSFVHLLDGAVLFGDLIAAEFLLGLESCLRWAFDPLWHGHGLLRIAGKAVDTSVYSSSLQQMLHKPPTLDTLVPYLFPPDADNKSAMHYGMLSLTLGGKIGVNEPVPELGRLWVAFTNLQVVQNKPDVGPRRHPHSVTHCTCSLTVYSKLLNQ
jgi:hypothetical protein